MHSYSFDKLLFSVPFTDQQFSLFFTWTSHTWVNEISTAVQCIAFVCIFTNGNDILFCFWKKKKSSIYRNRWRSEQRNGTNTALYCTEFLRVIWHKPVTGVNFIFSCFFSFTARTIIWFFYSIAKYYSLDTVSQMAQNHSG